GLDAEAEPFVEAHRALVALLRVHDGAIDAPAVHPAQGIDDEGAADATVLLVGVDREPLQEAALGGASSDRVADDAIIVRDPEPARRRRRHRLVEPGLVEPPERLERA